MSDEGGSALMWAIMKARLRIRVVHCCFASSVSCQIKSLHKTCVPIRFCYPDNNGVIARHAQIFLIDIIMKSKGLGKNKSLGRSSGFC